jgi:hypothetical protein
MESSEPYHIMLDFRRSIGYSLKKSENINARLKAEAHYREDVSSNGQWVGHSVAGCGGNGQGKYDYECDRKNLQESKICTPDNSCASLLFLSGFKADF